MQRQRENIQTPLRKARGREQAQKPTQFSAAATFAAADSASPTEVSGWVGEWEDLHLPTGVCVGGVTHLDPFEKLEGSWFIFKMDWGPKQGCFM